MLQRVRMLGTQQAVNDGEIRPSTFIEGREYDVGPELLQSFFDLGIVELIDQEKSDDHAPANKMKKAAPENKAG